MKEAAMHEYDLAAAWKHKVWLAWKTFAVEPIAIAEPVDNSPHPNFRACILTSYEGHANASCFGRQRVWHHWVLPRLCFLANSQGFNQRPARTQPDKGDRPHYDSQQSRALDFRSN